MESIVTALTWFALVSAGVMAGVYFTFSVFAMRAFAALGDEAGARAMQSINRVILKSAFLPLFFLSTLASLALVAIGLAGMAGAGGTALAAGGALYVVGMFGVTAAGNVPLNNRLDAADPASEAGQALWRLYLRRWTALNHLRTLACTAALILFAIALA
jgi:uncharacterized membrane protein